MKILIADKLSEHALSALKVAGLDADFRPDLSAAELPAAIGSFNVLVVRSTKVTADTISAADSLSLIVRAGAGVNTIDVAAASDGGIYVTNCPGRNSDAVAELAIGLLVACDRRIADATAELRSGHWNKKKYSGARGLKGRTLGILGMGMIGRAVARRAHGLEMDVIAWSRSLTSECADTLGVQFAESPLAVAKACDAVSIHLATTAETRSLVDAEFLAAMPDGGIVVNSSRGELVDTAALKEAIRKKGLRVGLDVFEDEPGAGVAEFADTDLAGSVTCTPHIGASTQQASEAIAAEVVEIINTFRETGRPTNVVNVSARTSATHSLVIRHYNRVGVLAGVLDALRKADINVEEMDNAIFEGAGAACCTLQLDEAPSQNLIGNLSQLDHVLQVQLEPR
ncbi:MAG: hydroxyacid dehydrogenase [Planctomycetaceae bacterium]|jgi:D-3-phosphoglycerate dehydrogenase / 2-oxoglutarate reductase|nr:hydroxyacid dehydrogenase [Planctomycetaceae bacterium]MBT6153311.1 hydroxyacid dehydrogenase [Planctomycetaceae bacterium]MBT6483230.1 hydroxyacid dehydrogenase [Planctomycetaceae bacterium]MBT6496333.1 hydroxyacid dehydrogenase [Planctomycetaceae bacterium]